jgi:hypothetical protein
MSFGLRVASFLTRNTEPVTGKLKAAEVGSQESEVKKQRAGNSPPFAFGEGLIYPAHGNVSSPRIIFMVF